MTRLTRSVLLAFLVLAGLLFGCDASTFSLRVANPARGRGRGCYTLLDDLFGTTRPSDPLRALEHGLCILLVGVAGVIWYRERTRAGAAARLTSA
jgi:hypothetical protein